MIIFWGFYNISFQFTSWFERMSQQTPDIDVLFRFGKHYVKVPGFIGFLLFYMQTRWDATFEISFF